MVRLARQLRRLILSPRCIFCREFLPAEEDTLLCARCRALYYPLSLREFPIPGGVCRYLLDYRAEVRSAVLLFKFRGRAQFAGAFASLLVPGVRELGTFDCVTWAPVSGLRAQSRGYDQSGLLAKSLARELGIPARRLLKKTRHTKRQSRLSYKERAGNVRDAYALRAGQSIEGLRVLLLDDIVTSGATLGACRSVLQKGGASEVIPVALAH